jgi:hypothetical protein
MHLDQEQIERLVHDEANAEARAHVAVCDECSMRVVDARNLESEVFDLLSHIDNAGMRPRAADVIERARGAGGTSFRWAAGIVLALGLAGAALALPGSPLRAWLRHSSEPQTVAEPAASGAASDRVTGIAVAPGNDLTIEFQNAQEQGVARVRIVAEGDVVVRALAGTATFTSGTSRLLIANSGTGDFEIDIPRAAPRVEILLGGRQLLLKQGAAVSGDAAIDSSGAYVLDLQSTAR